MRLSWAVGRYTSIYLSNFPEYTLRDLLIIFLSHLVHNELVSLSGELVGDRRHGLSHEGVFWAFDTRLVVIILILVKVCNALNSLALEVSDGHLNLLV